MTFRTFLAWQWQDYARAHRDCVNFLIHLVAVPMFIASTMLAPLCIFGGRFAWLAAATALFLISIGLQAIGHKRETFPPAPFKGSRDFWTRLFAEQFITFPRFVVRR